MRALIKDFVDSPNCLLISASGLICIAMLLSISPALYWLSSKEVTLGKAQLATDAVKWGADLLKLVFGFGIATVFWTAYQKRQTKTTIEKLVTELTQQCTSAAQSLTALHQNVNSAMPKQEYENIKLTMPYCYRYILTTITLIREKYLNDSDIQLLRWVLDFSAIEEDLKRIIEAIEKQDGIIYGGPISSDLSTLFPGIIEWLNRSQSMISTPSARS